jgi:diacylglycerol kinase (ATP)
MKLLLIYNPHAAHGNALRNLSSVEELFRARGLEFDLRLTLRPGHAVELVRAAELRSYDGVVAAGGDGTLFETVTGFYRHRSPPKIPIGVLPMGTGNAFARDLGLEADRFREAVDVIACAKPRKVDVGRITTGGERYYFMNIVGLGFVSDVVQTASRLKFIGNLSYTIGVLLRTVFLGSYGIRIEADGRVLERENIFTEISNTRYTSNFLMAPDASIDDGLLDVTLLSRINRRRLLQCFPLIFTGKHVSMPEVETFKARHISITTDRPKVLTPDGELLGGTPVEIECLPRDVEVFWK